MANFNFIGTGIAYPLDIKAGFAPIVTGISLIESSLRQILAIEVGSLPHNPYFGSNLNRLEFQPSDIVVISAGKTYIVEAIKKWEGRVQVTHNDIVGFIENEHPEIVNFEITYKVLALNAVKTFVFPFYRQLKF